MAIFMSGQTDHKLRDTLHTLTGSYVPLLDFLTRAVAEFGLIGPISIPRDEM